MKDKFQQVVAGLYSIYDRITEKADPLFEQPNDKAAIRFVNNLLERHPQLGNGDFCLIKVGERLESGAIQLKSVAPLSISGEEYFFGKTEPILEIGKGEVSLDG